MGKKKFVRQEESSQAIGAYFKKQRFTQDEVGNQAASLTTRDVNQDEDCNHGAMYQEHASHDKQIEDDHD